MKINLAKSAGFCFGVKRAIEIALETARSHSQVYMLGDIVHNSDVVREIEKAGIKKIKRLTSGGKNKILLIRAHGASADTFKKAADFGYQIIDATCPMVREIHKIAKNMEQRGYKIIVIGDKKHDEVQGIVGQLKGKAIVIHDITCLPLKAIRKTKKAAIVVQSTQNTDKVLKIVAVLKQSVKELEFFNTICRPTRMKQQDLKKMPRQNDLMIIIGSKTSANTKRLYEIAKSLNRRSFWVGSEKEIKPRWFNGLKSVGVTAGASTPDATTKGIIRYLKQIN